MLARTLDFVKRYEDVTGPVDVANDMTMLTYEILAETLFSGEIAGEAGSFAHEIDRLFETMGRVDPLDLLRAPEWLPRLTRLRGRKTMAYFRKIVTDTVAMRSDKLRVIPAARPQDFLTLLLRAEGPEGLTPARRSKTTSSPSSAPAMRPRRGHSAGPSTASRRRPGSATGSNRRSMRCCRASPTRSNGSMPCLSLAPSSTKRSGFIRRHPRSTANRSTEDEYKGFKIPRKAQVLVMPWDGAPPPQAVGPSQRLHARAFPSRNRDRIDRYQYLPFGAGPRVCIGMSFAMQEAIIALAIMLSRFRFDTTAETKPWPVQKLTTQPQGGLPMRVTRR
jgi:cytochrome P450